VKRKYRKHIKDNIKYSETYVVFLGFPVFLNNIVSQNKMTDETYHTRNISGLCYRSVNFEIDPSLCSFYIGYCLNFLCS